MSSRGPFSAYAEAGFLGEVIPILPPNAKLTPDSKIDPRQQGKIPGSFSAHYQAWSGLPDWTTRISTMKEIERWDTWPSPNVGLRAAHFPAIDIDCDDQAAVDKLVDFVFSRLGETLVRGRENSARVLLPYRLRACDDPPSKMRITFGGKHAIELLGRGQQYVVHGIHPSGARYLWRNGIDPTTLFGAETLREVTAEQWLAFGNS